MDQTKKNLDAALFVAAKWGDPYFVLFLLRKGADVGKANQSGETPLFWAALSGNVRVVQLLLRAGADVGVVSRSGETALFQAARSGNVGVIQVLLQHGADSGVVANSGHTALFCAVGKGSDEAVQLLLQSGAVVNAVNRFGETALFSAVEAENDKVVQTILQGGADVNIVSTLDGENALFPAVRSGNEKIVKLLSQRGADVGVVNDRGETALTLAMRIGNKRIAQLLLQSGVNVGVMNNLMREKILFLAAQTGNERVAEHLLQRGADSCRVNQFGQTALFEAVAAENDKTVALLLQSGAEVDRTNRDDITALFVAIETENEKVVQLLLQSGADAGFVDPYGETPLFAAVETGNEIIVQLLLQHGSDVNVVNEDGETALFSAACMCYEHENIVQLLLQHGANVNVVNKGGETALFSVVDYVYENENVVQLLLQHGADVGVVNDDGKTVLFPAVKCGDDKCVQLLLQNGADPTVLDKDANSILSFAGSPEVLKLLLDSGANVALRNVRGESVLHFLLSSRSVEKNSESRQQVISHLARDARFCLSKSRDNQGNTTLHFWATPPAALEVSLIKPIGQELIDNGAVVNAVNDKCQTALHCATSWNAVEVLIANSAHPNPQDDQGQTPLLCIASLLSTEIPCNWEAILQTGMDPFLADNNGNTVAGTLLSQSKFEAVSGLVKAVKDHHPREINWPHTNGEMLLHIVCRQETDQVQSLLDQLLLAGANPNVQNSDKETPLHIECRKVMEMANSHSEDDTLASAHFWATGRLLKYGADPSALNGAGESCLDLASSCAMLKELLNQPVDLLAIPALLPWCQQSEQHRDKLAQVSRGQRSEREGKYQFHTEHIGSGAFGDVHAGINTSDGREVAVKCIERRHLNSPEDRREVRNLVKLQDCDQVVKYIDVLENEPQRRVFIVLELMEGNLDDCLDLGPLDASILGELCKDIITGLAHLHRADILHRDIKPTNILYKKTYRPCLKIADFGLSSKEGSGAQATTTVMRTGAGTRCWLAPEILRTSDTPRHAKETDIFACGLVLHYLLAKKRHPFAPVDTSGKSPVMLQNETERKIIDGSPAVDVSLSPESRDLVELMIKDSARERLSADEALDHVFFWSKEKRVRFTCAVANQPEFGAPRSYASSHVITELETTLGVEFASTPWNMKIPSIFTEMTSTRKGKPYNTRSAVHLVRFVRNSHAHISERARSTPMKNAVLGDFVFFREFPTLFMDVYKAVKQENWDALRDEIAQVVKE